MANVGDHEEWLGEIEAALAAELPEDTRNSLEYFLNRVRRHREMADGNLLSAAMSFLDGMDYEKRPWEDDSSVLWTAMEFGGPGFVALLTEALGDENRYARRMAAKWLPKYLVDEDCVPMLQHALKDVEPEVRWWAAIHLSRLAPGTAGLIPVLVEALHADWYVSARLCWDYDLHGKGEAAEALGKLGAAAEQVVPELVAAIPKMRDYDAQLAGRALGRIAGTARAIELLTPLVTRKEALGRVLDELQKAEAGEEILTSPDDPLHACFVARFIWREGEDDYWRFRKRDGRGAF